MPQVSMGLDRRGPGLSSRPGPIIGYLFHCFIAAAWQGSVWALGLSLPIRLPTLCRVTLAGCDPLTTSTSWTQSPLCLHMSVRRHCDPVLLLQSVERGVGH